MNKYSKFLIVMFLLLTLTGCTKTLKDDKKKPVKNPKTGQVLTENILCKPTNEEVIKLYNEHNVNLDNLPKCSDFKINSGKYESVWTSFIVKPLTYFIVVVNNITKNAGLSIIIVSLIIRIILFPLFKKSSIQSENLKKAKPEIEVIEKKYKGKTDRDSLLKKQQETVLIYKKHNISMGVGCIVALLQLPIMFGFLEAVNRTPLLFEGNFLGLELGTTPYVGGLTGNPMYVILIILNICLTYYSFTSNMRNMDESQRLQTKGMAKLLMVVVLISSLSFVSAIGLYWIVSTSFSIFQNKLIRRNR